MLSFACIFLFVNYLLCAGSLSVATLIIVFMHCGTIFVSTNFWGASTR